MQHRRDRLAQRQVGEEAVAMSAEHQQVYLLLLNQAHELFGRAAIAKDSFRA